MVISYASSLDPNLTNQTVLYLFHTVTITTQISHVVSLSNTHSNRERSVEGLESNVELVVLIMNKIELEFSINFISQLFFNI